MDLDHSRRTFLKRLSAAAAAPIAGQFMAVDEILARGLEGLTDLAAPLPAPQEIRSRYLLDARITYLNHASIGTVPSAVHAAGIRYREICEENPWLYIWGGAWEEAREEVRRKAAALLGCDPRQVAITHNTTEGFNVLAQGLPLEEGDEVLFSNLNHSGASICWDHASQARGYSVRRFQIPLAEVPGLTKEDVVALHAAEIREETRVLVLPHIDNIVGLRHPLRQITEMARARGVEFILVDGAQSAGMIPLDLESSGVDAYSTSPHKWVQSVKGLGLLFVRDELLERLKPMWVTWGQAQWAGTARIFEDYGTRDFPEVLSLGDALDFQNAMGAARKETVYRTMFEEFKSQVDASPAVAWRSPRSWDMGSILVSVHLQNGSATPISERLFERHGVVLRPFPQADLNALRVSPNLMNAQDELSDLLALLERGV